MKNANIQIVKSKAVPSLYQYKSGASTSGSLFFFSNYFYIFYSRDALASRRSLFSLALNWLGKIDPPLNPD